MHHVGAENYQLSNNLSNSLISEQILEQLNLAVVLVDRELKVLFANQQAASVFGHTRKKLLNQTLLRLPIKHTFPENLFSQLWESQQSFADHEVEWTFIDGRHISSEVNADLVMLNNEPACLLQIRDNDNLKKLNTENAHKHHISASRHLIRGLAHEIKNPLGGIRGAAQLLSRSLDSDELREYTQMIIDQSDRLKELVDRLLGPNTPPKRSLTNIHGILERVVSLVQIELNANTKITKDYDPSLPEILVDEGQIEQALLNILQNAVYAASHANEGSARSVVVRTRFEGNKVLHGSSYKKVLKISIIDNGTGIAESIKSTLFYPMITDKPEGNGLGLSISQRLIDQHKGVIEVDSWPGHTEFSIYLPIQEMERHA